MDKLKAERIISIDTIADTDGTWAQCTRKENLLFISGQVALDGQGNVVGNDDFEIQARRTLDNLKSMLEAGGASLEDLMMITVYLTDMENRPIFARVRDSYFRKNPPASSMVEVNRLVLKELMLEVDGIAVLG